MFATHTHTGKFHDSKDLRSSTLNDASFKCKYTILALIISDFPRVYESYDLNAVEF